MPVVEHFEESFVKKMETNDIRCVLFDQHWSIHYFTHLVK